jgi:uncharacterized protein (TIGR00299 family) protein
VSRVVYFDCHAGLAGDMLLGALVDLGLPLDTLRDAVATLHLGGYRIDARTVKRGGLAATKIDVLVESEDHRHARHHHGRHLSEIVDLIARSRLEPAVKEKSTALFRRMAEVEAAAHGVGIEEVHFHEVGAVDAIVDVVGGVFGLAWLGAARFVASPVNVGGGSVDTQHGALPVPAPATLRLLEGAPVFGSGDCELTTPTGALLLTGHAAEFGPLPVMSIEKAGYGAGERETKGRPNVFRLVVGSESTPEEGAERVLLLETEIDDMLPQIFGPLIEKLLAAGALDAYFTPIQMKKGRPGLLLTVLAAPMNRGEIERIMFTETTTLGVRRQECVRTTLAREIVSVDTRYGSIRVKVARYAGRFVGAQPEFDDCALRAREHGLPLKEVWSEALAAYRSSKAQGL